MYVIAIDKQNDKAEVDIYPNGKRPDVKSFCLKAECSDAANSLFHQIGR